MNIRRLTSGRWQARLKQGRVDIGSKSFLTKREAEDWLRRRAHRTHGRIRPEGRPHPAPQGAPDLAGRTQGHRRAEDVRGGRCSPPPRPYVTGRSADRLCHRAGGQPCAGRATPQGIERVVCEALPRVPGGVLRLGRARANGPAKPRDTDSCSESLSGSRGNAAVR